MVCLGGEGGYRHRRQKAVKQHSVKGGFRLTLLSFWSQSKHLKYFLLSADTGIENQQLDSLHGQSSLLSNQLGSHQSRAALRTTMGC